MACCTWKHGCTEPATLEVDNKPLCWEHARLPVDRKFRRSGYWIDEATRTRDVEQWAASERAKLPSPPAGYVWEEALRICAHPNPRLKNVILTFSLAPVQ